LSLLRGKENDFAPVSRFFHSPGSGSHHPQPYLQNFTIPGEHLSVISNTLLGDMADLKQRQILQAKGSKLLVRDQAALKALATVQ
jgi:hypothetical protein